MTTVADAPPDAPASAPPEAAPEAAEAAVTRPADAAGATPPPPSACLPSSTAPLSKNQQKKLKRYEEKKARITALKAAAKATKAVETAARRAAACARIDGMSAEDKAAWRAAKHEKQAARRAETAARHARLDATNRPGAPLPHVLIDLCPAYDALMTPREVTSLGSQLRACYAHNAASAHPLRLTIAGLTPAWETAMGGPSSGMHAWRVGKTSAGFMEAAVSGMVEGKDGEAAAAAAAAAPSRPVQIVYLSADAPEEEVSELEPGVAYVIGGLVDRNRHKGIAARRAHDCAASAPPGATVRAARLPIGAHIAALTASAVLTVDQVARLLVRWWEEKQKATHEGGEAGQGAAHGWWATAVGEAVPARKRRGGEGEGGGSEEGG